MEITTEIKEKVFAQYLGTKSILYVGGKIVGESNLTTNILNQLSKNDVKLVLKPLSEMSQEDSFKVMKLSGFEYKIESKQFELAGALFSDWNDIPMAYQYLQSKGYDLPNYLLGKKTLEECGLAIYEN